MEKDSNSSIRGTYQTNIRLIGEENKEIIGLYKDLKKMLSKCSGGESNPEILAAMSKIFEKTNRLKGEISGRLNDLEFPRELLLCLETTGSPYEFLMKQQESSKTNNPKRKLKLIQDKAKLITSFLK